MSVEQIFETLSDVTKASRDEVLVTIPDGSWLNMLQLYS